MRRRLGVLTLALGLAGVAIEPSAAQPRPGSPEAAGFTQLFISPCGEPYRGRPGEPYPVALWFKQADLNHDGVIDRAEFRADHAGFFDALDADGDGVLNGEELAFYESHVAPDVFAADRFSRLSEPPALAGRQGARLILAQSYPGGLGQAPEGSHPGETRSYSAGGAKGAPPSLDARRPERRELVGAAAYGLLGEAEPVRGSDRDLDGRISKAEFMEAADRRFALLDKRHDGKLTLDELPMTPWQVAQARGGRKG